MLAATYFLKYRFVYIAAYIANQTINMPRGIFDFVFFFLNLLQCACMILCGFLPGMYLVVIYCSIDMGKLNYVLLSSLIYTKHLLNTCYRLKLVPGATTYIFIIRSNKCTLPFYSTFISIFLRIFKQMYLSCC